MFKGIRCKKVYTFVLGFFKYLSYFVIALFMAFWLICFMAKFSSDFGLSLKDVAPYVVCPFFVGWIYSFLSDCVDVFFEWLARKLGHCK